MEKSTLDLCLLDMHALELEMCYLELEHSTRGPFSCVDRLIVVD
jgi:hypothetical protein